MEIARRPDDVDLEIREAAQRRKDRRQSRREHGRIGDDDGLAGELLRVLLDELLEVGAAHFFLAFGEDDDVDGKLARGLEVRLDRLQMEEQLAFVVDGAAGEDLVVADRGLEGRRLPELERLGGLHVVVPIDEERGLAWSAAPFAENY